jgi:hypothetical protein
MVGKIPNQNLLDYSIENDEVLASSQVTQNSPLSTDGG